MPRFTVLTAVSAACAIIACDSAVKSDSPAPVNLALDGTVSASATWENNPRLGPAKVIDGSNYDDSVNINYWTLPNRTTGWWQVDLGRQAEITSIQILNTNGSTANDRATKDFRVEILGSDRTVAFSQSGVLPFTSKSSADHPIEPYAIKLDKARAGRYVKVYVDSWYPTRTDPSWPYPVVASSNPANEGGGLNEVRVFGTP